MTGNQPAVELFTQSHCAPCAQVERFLADRGVAFFVRDVTDDPAALAMIVERGFMATPVTRIGERWIGGFRKNALQAALNAALID